MLALAAMRPDPAAATILNGNADLVLGQNAFTTQVHGDWNKLSLSNPAGAALDATTGRVYVADSSHNRVLWWNNAASLTSGKAADGVLGQPDFTSQDQSATAQGMYGPTDVAVDASGRVWVADAGNNRVLRLSAPSANGQAANLVLGQPDFTSNASATNASGMNYPTGVAVDGSGNVWVVDQYNHRVLRYGAPSANGQAADLVVGQPDFTSNDSNASNPSGTNASGMNIPTSVAVDGAGDVWVADTNNHRVLHYVAPSSNGQAADFAVGQADLISNGTGATATTLNHPRGVKKNGTGLWVADGDNNRVLHYAAPANNAAADLVLGQADFVSAGAAATHARMSTPAGLAVDGSGDVWVADGGNNRVLRFSAPSNNGVAADLVLGQVDFTSNGRATTAQGVTGPAGDIAVDGSGNVWIADIGSNRLLRYNAPAANYPAAALVLGQSNFNSSGYATTATGVFYPQSVALDGSGNVWAADTHNNRVLRYSAPITNGKAADLVLGQTDFTQSGAGNGAANNLDEFGLDGPLSVAVDGSGKVWVADANNNRVLRYSPPLTNGKAADIVLGQTNFISIGGNTTAQGLFNPTSVKVDGSGHVWVADQLNNRVLRYSAPSANGQAADLVLGQPDFVSAGTAVSAQGMNSPFGLAIDGSGNLWVSDSGNYRALRYGTPSANGQAADRVLGQADFTSNVFGTTVHNFSNASGAGPRGLAVDGSGNLWAGDVYNYRVLEFLGAGGGGTTASDLSGARVYPIPYRPNGGNPDQGGGGTGITFDNLTKSARIKIYTLSGSLLANFGSDNTGGKLQWDARNDAGQDVASGGYLAVISSPGVPSSVKKILIRR